MNVIVLKNKVTLGGEMFLYIIKIAISDLTEMAIFMEVIIVLFN